MLSHVHTFVEFVRVLPGEFKLALAMALPATALVVFDGLLRGPARRANKASKGASRRPAGAINPHSAE